MADELGLTYWSLIEPHWLPMNASWDDGPDKFLAKFRSLSVKVGHLYAAHWRQSEVCNGGLHQFFFNTTGILAPEALKAFEAIGLIECSQIVEEAISYFDSPYPRERACRVDRLPRPDGRKREDWDPFYALDDRFYRWLHAEADAWYKAADNYARSG